MELNTLQDVDNMTTFQTIKKVEKLESNIARLKHIPTIVFAVILFWAVPQVIFESVHHLTNTILLALAILIVGQSNVKRSELLMELFELKYGK